MNEFEQFIASNYGIAPGADVPDDVYDAASAAFLQSKSTVQNIDPAQNNFDLAAAVETAPVQAQAAPAAANEPNPLQGTPFDYGATRPILEELYLDTQLKDDLFKGSKFGDDKTKVVGHYDNKLNNYYAPRLAEAGVSLGQAVAGVNAAIKQGKSVDEVFAGAPAPEKGRETDEESRLVWLRNEALKNRTPEDLSSEEKAYVQSLDRRLASLTAANSEGAPDTSPLGQLERLDTEMTRVGELVRRRATNTPYETLDGESISGGQFNDYRKKLTEQKARAETDLLIGLQNNDADLLQSPRVIAVQNFLDEEGNVREADFKAAVKSAPSTAIIYNGRSVMRKSEIAPRPVAGDADSPATAGAQDALVSTIQEAEQIISAPDVSVAEKASAQARAAEAREELRRRAERAEASPYNPQRVEAASEVASGQEALRSELSTLMSSLFRTGGFRQPYAALTRNVAVDDDTFERGLQRIAELRAAMGEDPAIIEKELQGLRNS